MTAVLASAVIFALVHFIGDPNTLPFLPALAGLGAVLAVVALRTGDLSAADLHPRRLQPDDHDHASSIGTNGSS